ncbi:unnamed protein product, partial [Chrysoparadoxa australica]
LSGRDDVSIIGGSGNDLFDFGHISGPITVNLDGNAGTITGDGTDSVSGIDHIIGSDGNATFGGGTGNDTLDGHDGLADTLTFSDAALGGATSAVTIDIENSLATGFGTHTITGFEHIIGSAQGDTITGGTGADALTLDGGAGDDTINANTSDESIIGNAGTDTLSYTAKATGSLNVTFSGDDAGVVTGLGNDTFDGIEVFVSGNHDDSITGSSADDSILGSGGSDQIDAVQGNDDISGGTGNDSIT